MNPPPTIELTPPATASSALAIVPEEGSVIYAGDDFLVEESMDLSAIVPALLATEEEDEPEYPEGSGPYGF